jgi:hypothetical protein
MMPDMKPFVIHIFCLKSEICHLLKKKLRLDGYAVSCTNLTEVDDDFLCELSDRIDCIILDRDVNDTDKNKIISRFPDLPKICLPSLDSDVIEVSGITYVPEPLKLSELCDIITEIRNRKEIESKA